MEVLKACRSASGIPTATSYGLTALSRTSGWWDREKQSVWKRITSSRWGEIAERSQYDEEFFYRTFGIDGEILIAHAWGMDPVRISDIKGYHSSITGFSDPSLSRMC